MESITPDEITEHLNLSLLLSMLPDRKFAISGSAIAVYDKWPVTGSVQECPLGLSQDALGVVGHQSLWTSLPLLVLHEWTGSSPQTWASCKQQGPFRSQLCCRVKMMEMLEWKFGEGQNPSGACIWPMPKASSFYWTKQLNRLTLNKVLKEEDLILTTAMILLCHQTTLLL